MRWLANIEIRLYTTGDHSDQIRKPGDPNIAPRREAGFSHYVHGRLEWPRLAQVLKVEAEQHKIFMQKNIERIH